RRAIAFPICTLKQSFGAHLAIPRLTIVPLPHPRNRATTVRFSLLTTNSPLYASPEPSLNLLCPFKFSRYSKDLPCAIPGLFYSSPSLFVLCTISSRIC